MPPKRPNPASGKAPAKKKRVASTDIEERLSESEKSLHIDYDKLAAAVLKQQEKSANNCEVLDVDEQQQPNQVTGHVGASTSSGAQGHQELPNFISQLFSVSGSKSTGSLVRQTNDANSTGQDLHLTDYSSILLKASLAPASTQAYLRSWLLLISYCNVTNTQFMFPCSTTMICNFVGELFHKPLSPATILSHISAISYVHKLYEVQDPTHSFIVRKILKGAQNLGKSADTRLPITKHILTKLISALKHTVPDADCKLMLTTIFLLAFHGFMRLGELVSRNKSYHSKVIQRQDICFIDDSSVQITLKHFKNMKDNAPITITLCSNEQPQFCPVQFMKAYIARFQPTSGPLFSFKSGSPVSHKFVTSHLKQAITFIGLNPSIYLGHSFRIGAATEAAKNGMSENAIKQLGRWNSNAIQRYIRINAFKF